MHALYMRQCPCQCMRVDEPATTDRLPAIRNLRSDCMTDKPGSSNYIVIGSKTTNVTISPALQSQSAPRRVLVTCLPKQSQNQPTSIKKALLKAVSRQSKGKELKVLTLRYIVPDKISCCSDVKSLIKAQLSDEITVDDFDLGYVQGNSVVNIRSKADLDEIWEGLKKDKVLLCVVMAYRSSKS